MVLGDWVRDPLVRSDGKGGAPPDGHVRRCQGRNKFGNQCGEWALRGTHYCRIHGGAYGRVKRKKMARNLYSRRAVTKMKDLLDQLANEDPTERMKLVDEIDMARLIAEKAVRMFEVVFFQREDETEEEWKERYDRISEDLRIRVQKQLQESLSHVSSLVEKYAKVSALSATTLSIEQFDYLQQSIIKALNDYLLPEHEDVYNKVVKMLGELKLPQKNTVSINIQ